MPFNEEEKQEIRNLLNEEFANLQTKERYTFQKDVEIFNGRNIRLGTQEGTKIGTASAEKLGLWGVTPVDQPATVSDPSIGTVTGSGADATINSNFSNLQTAVVAIIDRLQESGNIQ